MHVRLAAASLAAALLLTALPGPLLAQRANEPITLNFVNAEIEAVARTMAAITGRNIGKAEIGRVRPFTRRRLRPLGI